MTEGSDADSEILISTWKPGGRDQFKNIHLPFGNDLIRLKNPDTIEPIIAFFGSKFNIGGVFAFLYDSFSKPGLSVASGPILRTPFVPSAINRIAMGDFLVSLIISEPSPMISKLPPHPNHHTTRAEIWFSPTNFSFKSSPISLVFKLVFG